MKHTSLVAGLALVCVISVPLGGCSASNDPGQPTGGAGGSPNLLGGDGSGGMASCASFSETVDPKPVNLYLVFDKSQSMAGNKWEAAKAGLSAFVDDESSEGISVALRFFPRDPDATPGCDQNAYKEPQVSFGALPANAGPIKAALDAESPDGFSTPMYPALGGALLKGIELATNNPDQVSAVLLITDGQPEGPAAMCGGINPEDPQAIADLATTGLNFSPAVTTYVVGLPGVDQTTANLVAAAGGSDQAILVASTNVQEEFQQALAKVRGDAVPCEYALPQEVLDGEVLVSEVNIEIVPSDGGAPQLVKQDLDCVGAGWTYNDPVMPTEIVLCEATCNALKQDLGASIDVVLGCATQIL